MKIKLKPCPVCGKEPDIMEAFCVMIGHVECDILATGATVKQAADAWNRREKTE